MMPTKPGMYMRTLAHGNEVVLLVEQSGGRGLRWFAFGDMRPYPVTDDGRWLGAAPTSEEADALRRERDEARAEVERLRTGIRAAKVKSDDAWTFTRSPTVLGLRSLLGRLLDRGAP